MVFMKYQWAGKISCVAVVCWSELKASSSQSFRKGLNAQGEFVPRAATSAFYPQQDFQAVGEADLIWERGKSHQNTSRMMSRLRGFLQNGNLFWHGSHQQNTWHLFVGVYSWCCIYWDDAFPTFWSFMVLFVVICIKIHQFVSQQCWELAWLSWVLLPTVPARREVTFTSDCANTEPRNHRKVEQLPEDFTAGQGQHQD